MSHPDRTQLPGQIAPEQTAKVGLVVDDRYRILELIGRGGMGAVYKAEHVGIGRMVAIKLLHPSLAQIPEVAKRFEREALAIGRTTHPNCVNVSDSGSLDDGSLFLVMEFLEGQSVGDLIADEGRVAPRRALHIMRHVLRGLSHAHGRHIVHRDIKPENIFLVTQGDDLDFAKILDFGIAKLLGSTDHDSVKLTQAGVAFGTPVYMSPEQAVGNPVDGRADLYAATVVLYEMLTGRPPFYSDDKLEVLSMHTTRQPPPLAETAPGIEVPPAVEELVMHGLAKRPNERFASAEEYIAAIDDVLAHTAGARVATRLPKRTKTVPVLYGPPPTMPRATTATPAPPSQRNGLIAILAMASVAVIIAIIALLTTRDGSQGSETAAPVPVQPVAVRAAGMLQADQPEAAIALLEDQGEAIDDDAAAQRQLGHAYALAGRQRDALRAYERALTLEPDSANDPYLRTNLEAMLSSNEVDIALDAADILLSKMSDEVAAAHLAELASSAKELAQRSRARDLAAKHDILGQVDLVASYSLDLAQGEHCEDRLVAVQELAELGDPRAIPALKEARYRRSSNRRKYRHTNINGCLTDDANKAIDALEKIEQAEGKDAAP